MSNALESITENKLKFNTIQDYVKKLIESYEL